MLHTLDDMIFKATNPVGVKLKNSKIMLPPSGFAYGKKDLPDKEGASILLRSWQFHSGTNKITPLNDFVKINKLAIKNKTNKEFRKTSDIRQIIPEGKKEKPYPLPPKEFAYGLKNRTPTPIKDVINYEYSNQAENEILRTYSNFKTERSKVFKLTAKSTRHFDGLLTKRRSKVTVEEKPLYKIKKFLKVDSKIKDHLSNFKTYLPAIKTGQRLESLIKKTEEDINDLEKNPEKIHLNTLA